MRYLLILLGLVSLVLTPYSATAENIATIRVPMCLQYPDRKVYTPCTGVVPVDRDTGDAMKWSDIFRGTTDKPNYTQETTRRIHWLERNTILVANQSFNGISRDDGSDNDVKYGKWNNFSCLVRSDQSGILMIQISDDNSNWTTVQSQPWTGGASLYLIQPVFTKYSRCSVTNGTQVDNSFMLYSAFGA